MPESDRLLGESQPMAAFGWFNVEYKISAETYLVYDLSLISENYWR